MKNEKINFYNYDEIEDSFNNFINQYDNYFNSKDTMINTSSNLLNLLNNNHINFDEISDLNEHENGLRKSAQSSIRNNKVRDYANDIYISKINFKDRKLIQDYKERKDRYYDYNDVNLMIYDNLNSGSKAQAQIQNNSEEFFSIKHKSDSPTNKKRPVLKVLNKKFKIVKNITFNNNNQIENKNENKSENQNQIENKNEESATNNELTDKKEDGIIKNISYQIDRPNKINVLLRKLTIDKKLKTETDKMELLKEWNHKAYIIQKFYHLYKINKFVPAQKNLTKLFFEWDKNQENLFLIYTWRKSKEINEIIIKSYSTIFKKLFFKQIKISEIFPLNEKTNKEMLIKNHNVITSNIIIYYINYLI